MEKHRLLLVFKFRYRADWLVQKRHTYWEIGGRNKTTVDVKRKESGGIAGKVRIKKKYLKVQKHQ